MVCKMHTPLTPPQTIFPVHFGKVFCKNFESINLVFYNEKIKEPIKSRLPNWSPSNFYNEKIKKPVKESQIFKSIFNDLNE